MAAGVVVIGAAAAVALDVIQTHAQRDEAVVLKQVTPRSGPDNVVFAASGQPLPPGTLVHIAEDTAEQDGWLAVRTGGGVEAESGPSEPVWIPAGSAERVVR